MSMTLQKTIRHFQTRVLKQLFCLRQRRNTKRRATVRVVKVGEMQARHLKRSTFKELGERLKPFPFSFAMSKGDSSALGRAASPIILNKHFGIMAP